MPEFSQKLNWKRFLLTAVLTISILLIFIFVLGKRISALANEIQDKKNQIEALANREKNINQLQDDYFKIKDDIPQVTKILPDQENVQEFIQYLEDLARYTSINMQIIFDDKINTEVQKNKYLIFDINISGKGINTQKFWQTMEKGPYFIKIISFSYDTVDGLDSDSQLKLKAKVFTNDPYSLDK